MIRLLPAILFLGCSVQQTADNRGKYTSNEGVKLSVDISAETPALSLTGLTFSIASAAGTVQCPGVEGANPVVNLEVDGMTLSTRVYSNCTSGSITVSRLTISMSGEMVAVYPWRTTAIGDWGVVLKENSTILFLRSVDATEAISISRSNIVATLDHESDDVCTISAELGMEGAFRVTINPAEGAEFFGFGHATGGWIQEPSDGEFAYDGSLEAPITHYGFTGRIGLGTEDGTYTAFVEAELEWDAGTVRCYGTIEIEVSSD